MIFVKLGRFFAYTFLILGVLRFGSGLLVLFGTENIEANRQASRVLLSAANSGEAIDEAFLLVLAGVVLGLLVQIATKSDTT